MMTYHQIRQWLTTALIATSLLLLTSCVAPVDREDPRNSMPKTFGLAETSNAIIPWSFSFPSRTLQKDANTLRKKNLELTAARARVEQAMASFKSAEAELLPRIDGTAGYSRSRIKDSDGRQTENLLSLGANLSWELDIWGRLRARREAAFLKASVQRALADQVALDLQGLLVETWVQYQAGRREAALLEEQRKTNSDLLRLLELRLKKGQSGALDVLRQRGRLVAVTRAMPGVRADREQAAAAYAVLLGGFPGAARVQNDEFPSLNPVKALPDPRQLLSSRPDLRAGYLALLTADQEVAAAIADRLPRISFGLSYSISGTQPVALKDDALCFGLGLLGPIFDAGRLKAEESRRKAEAKEALALLEQAMRVAVREIKDALSKERALQDEHALLQHQIELARRSVVSAKLRYLKGQQNYISVLDALRELQILQRVEIAVLRDQLINRARLHKALGAKWSNQNEEMD